MMKRKLLIISLIIVILVAFGFYFLKLPLPSQQPSEQLETKEEIKPTYKYVTEKPTGWFRTGQEADIILYTTKFNNSGGASTLNHPSKVATDGKRLIVSDTRNNRVLIWNEFPKTGKEKPNVVLGQENFDSYYPSNAKNKLFMPSFLSFDGSFLWVGEFKWSDRLLRFSVQPIE